MSMRLPTPWAPLPATLGVGEGTKGGRTVVLNILVGSITKRVPSGTLEWQPCLSVSITAISRSGNGGFGEVGGLVHTVGKYFLIISQPIAQHTVCDN